MAKGLTIIEAIKMWDFSDIDFVVIFCIALVSLLIILFTSIMFYFSRVGDRSFSRQVSDASDAIIIYTIDVKQNKVTYFYKSDMKHKVTSDTMSFYSKFHPNDEENVKNWIFSIFTDPSHAEQYMEADILMNNGKKPCFSLLKLLKYNVLTGLIHLEVRVLRYITPNNAPKQKNSKKVPVGIVKRSVIHDLISKSKSLRGYTFGIRFFYAKQKALSSNKLERYMTMTLKNVIYPFAAGKNQRQIMDDGGNDMFIFDLKISNKEGAMQLANSMAHELRKSMEVNGFNGYTSFAIGVVENGKYFQDFDTIIENVQEACITGQTSSSEIVFHQRNLSQQDDLNLYNEQIDHLMKEGVLRYVFRPIIDSKTSDIIAYFEYVKAYDSPFTSFQEMSKYAARVNKNKPLFAYIAKHVIPKFVSESPNNCSLFLFISLLDIDSVTDVIHNIPDSEQVDLVLVLDEQEVNENAGNLEALNGALSGLINEGFKIALLLKDKNLLLDDSVYHLFDYFIVGSSMLATIKMNNRIRLSTYTLIESLLKYNKPIIATDLENWQAVELIIESGIRYISSEVIAASEDMLLPLEKKKMEKVVAMAEKYGKGETVQWKTIK